MGLTLEICCFSLEDAIAADAGGADRIEYCSDPALGGVTPSLGAVEILREAINTEIWVILRPRGGDFVYNQQEKDTMIRDIRHFQSTGIQGVVTGALTAEGYLDLDFLKSLVSELGGLYWSFHRAFDSVVSPMNAMDDLISLNAKRILTSGGAPSADQGTDALRKYVTRAADQIEIQAGGGVREDNVLDIIKRSGVTALHTSLRDPSLASTTFQCISSERVREFKGLLDSGNSIL